MQLFLPCSAGIGRSGVFIAADIAMQQFDHEGEIDILQTLSSLRQDRGGMIQTKEQYVFLHKVHQNLVHAALHVLSGNAIAGVAGVCTFLRA